MPGLGKLPVLGALFSSKAYQRRETDLVIIVTPYLVKPMDPSKKPRDAGRRHAIRRATSTIFWAMWRRSRPRGSGALPTRANPRPSRRRRTSGHFLDLPKE